MAPLSLEEKLQRRFGPHAKLVVRQQQRPAASQTTTTKTASDDNEANKNLEESQKQPKTVFKASVTFKQLGFPVEIASIESDTFDKAEALVFETAMNSNVIALFPSMFRSNSSGSSQDEGEAMRELRELKRTVDDLRNACQTLGRILKFSVKPKMQKQQKVPSAGEPLQTGSPNKNDDPPIVSPPPTPSETATAPTSSPPVYGCRVYFRDDWSVTANLAFLHEARGYSPNDALSNCLREVGKRFADELASDAFVKADYLEAVRVLELHGKSVVAHVMGAPIDYDDSSSLGADFDGQRKQIPKKQEQGVLPTGDVDQQQHGNRSAAQTVTPSVVSIVARVTDHATSNSYEVRCADQESLVDAYRTIAQHLFNAEANTTPSSSTSSLLSDEVESIVGSPSSSIHNAQHNIAVSSGWLASCPVQAASRTVGGNIFTLADQADEMPLKLKLRYQCEGMLYHALESQLIQEVSPPPTTVEGNNNGAKTEESPSSFAEIARRMMRVEVEEIAPTGGLTLVVSNNNNNDAAAVEQVVSTRLYQYRATATLNGVQVGQSEGSGAYRVELDVWIQLLNHLLDMFPEMARFHFAHCYPTVEALERAAHHHDNYRLFNLKGKWTVYSVLGAISSTLLTPSTFAHSAGGASNNRFDKILTDFDGTNPSCRAEARIIVNDGYHTKAMIAKRYGPQRGHVLRMAVTDAIQQNFPNQFQIATQHDDFSGSLVTSDDVSAHGRRLRALPREKRVTHVNQMFGVIGCFGEEDYGWRALRIRTRTIAGDAARCIAELEAQVQGEKGRRIVAASPIAATAKNAKKLLIYQVCKQYFPKDLENYMKLGRGDARHPDALMADHKICRVYSAATPFFAQVLAMLDKRQPDLAPFSWRLERARRSGNHDDDDGSEESLLQPLHLQFKATVMGNNGDVVVAERFGEEGEGALSVVRSILRATCATYIKDAGVVDSIELWREFETSPPPPVSSSHDLCSVLFQMTLGGLGGGDGSSRDAVNTQQQLAAQGRPAVEVLCTKVNVGEWWLATVVLPNMLHVPIARAAGRTKREAHRGALMLAARTCFAKQLRYFSKNFVEVHAFTDEIFHERVTPAPEVTTGGKTTTGKRNDVSPDTLSPKVFLESCLAPQSQQYHDNSNPQKTLMRGLIVRYEQKVGSTSWECRLYSSVVAAAAAASEGAGTVDNNNNKDAEPTEQDDAAATKQQQDDDEEVQIGFGSGLSRAHALHDACVEALETHFAENVEKRRLDEPNFLRQAFRGASLQTVVNDDEEVAH